MDCHRPQLKPWLFALLLAGATTWPVAAQDATKPADLPIDKANSFMGSQHNSQSPLFNINNKPGDDYDILPGAQKPRPISPAEVQQMQKFLDDKKNWTLMTPQEILNIPTPEKIFGLPDPNHEENLSAEQRYMNRQERERNFSATNAVGRSDDLWGRDTSPFQSKRSDSRKLGPDGRPLPAAQNSYGQRPYGSSAFQTAMGPDQNPDSPDPRWHSAFTPPPTVPKPDTEQEAAMDRFRALLDPPPVEKPADVSAYSSTAPVLAPAPDPYLQSMPAFNPAGHSFTRVQNSANRPTGINPLPTITGQTPNQTVTAPKPLVKLPPWLSNEPQLGKLPQRPF